MNKEYTEDEIRENVGRRIEIAIELLEDHPHVVGTWCSKMGGEICAGFDLVNPDTDVMESMLSLDLAHETLKHGSEVEVYDYPDVVFEITWDVNQEYFCLEKNGEEVPFTEWSDNYEWDIGSWQNTINEFLEKAGYSRAWDEEKYQEICKHQKSLLKTLCEEQNMNWHEAVRIVEDEFGPEYMGKEYTYDGDWV